MSSDYVTVSAKIRRKVWYKLKKRGVRFSKIIRKALKEELDKLEKEELKEKLKKASKILQKLTEEEIIALIRTEMDERC